MAHLPWTAASDAPFAIIDFAEVVSIVAGDSTESTNERLKTAAGKGFLYLSNYGVSMDEMATLVRTVQGDITEMSEEQRASLADDSLAGYRPLGAESTAKLLKTGSLDDLCWKYTWLETGGPAPNDLFKTIMQGYYAKMAAVASTLLKALAKVLDVDLGALIKDDKSVAGRGVLRFLNYVPVPEEYCHDEPRDVRMGAHPDLDLLTLLYQEPCLNGVPSLQARIDDSWVDVPAVQDTLVINFGEVFTMLTNQQVPATYHRVVCPGAGQAKGSERVSMPFFYEPDPKYKFSIPEWSKFAVVGAANDKLTFGEFIQSAIAILPEL
eukprot:m.58686 g.58686  ORF g.58686 m.58686 type:complete len:323 (-) comp13782_c0_seq1:1071-2039(-)